MNQEQEKAIQKAISETTWEGAARYVKALKRNGFQCWDQLPELFRSYEQIAKAAEGYVAAVPSECDRITWRGNYYHLPLKERV
jgi:hypothetical protein